MDAESTGPAPAPAGGPTPEQQRAAVRTGGIIGLAGGVVLFASLFLPWYKDDFSDVNPLARRALEGKEETYSAFQGLERTDVLVAVLAGLAIVVALVALASLIEDPGLIGIGLSGLGVVAAAVLLIKGSDAPEPKAAFGIGTSLEPFFWVAVAASLAILAGGLVALRRRTPRPPDEESAGARPAA
jgi:hypothetical protein